jgi:erythromycin esterase-like protein
MPAKDKTVDSELLAAIEKHAAPLSGALGDYDPVINAATGKHYVLIGEATHGTAEFYRARAEITQRLIEERGFDAVAVEADWPDAYAVHRYVSSPDSNATAEQALAGFERFPSWMWRNVEVLHFVEWLKAHNDAFRRPGHAERWPAGFYGLDMYSLSASIHAVLAYLDNVDPTAARRARERYSCLDHFMENPQAYAHAEDSGRADCCEKQIVTQLMELRSKAFDYIKHGEIIAEDEFFCARQNARVVRSAEKYYRSLYRGWPDSWNLRDRHMFETLEELSDHLGHRLGRDARIVVWAHNSHVGNAAATEMKERGEWNIGQLVREKYLDKALLVGFSTCHGTVTAAASWDDPPQFKEINYPFPRSYEDVFHHVNHKAFLLDLRSPNDAIDRLREPRLQRAIGVVYRPETERESHYFFSRLPGQFDFLIHFDETNAVQPLATLVHGHPGEAGETYPYGL